MKKNNFQVVSGFHFTFTSALFSLVREFLKCFSQSLIRTTYKSRELQYSPEIYIL